MDFDDESTRVFEPQRAETALEGKPQAEASTKSPSAASKSANPPAAFPQPGSAAAVFVNPEARSASNAPTEKEPSVVVSLAEKEAQAKSSSKPPPLSPPRSPMPEAALQTVKLDRPSHRDLGGIQNERTRVIRAVTKPTQKQKKDSGIAFWVFLFIALAAAAAGGFIASERLQHHALPSFLRNL
jgi:hypothetical protein